MPELYIAALWSILVGVALFLLDRVLLWVEERGWIYYRKSKKSGGPGVGDAFLEVQKLLEPTRKYTLEARQEDKKKQSETGDPPDPGEDD